MNENNITIERIDDLRVSIEKIRCPECNTCLTISRSKSNYRENKYHYYCSNCGGEMDLNEYYPKFYLLDQDDKEIAIITL